MLSDAGSLLPDSRLKFMGNFSGFSFVAEAPDAEGVVQMQTAGGIQNLLFSPNKLINCFSLFQF
jgi:hypothetical protein